MKTRLSKLLPYFFILGLTLISQAEEKEYPFGVQLQVLSDDITDPKYLDVLKTMISTDLAAEWQRVATPDNYLTFQKRHGGPKSIENNSTLKQAYNHRRLVAHHFLELMKQAYHQRDREAPFTLETVEQLCLTSVEQTGISNDSPLSQLRILMPAPDAEQQWPRFRGPSGQGTASSRSIPLHWSPTENIFWKVRVTGTGNSSPIIWDDRIFLTTSSEDGSKRDLLCFKRSDGSLIWRHRATAPVSQEKLYWKNTFTSSTPVTDGQFVIAFLGNSGLVCCDLNGNLQWEKSLGVFETTHGPGTSPILYRNLVIFIQDQNRGASVFIALDKVSGKKVWRQEREPAMGWSTPITVRVRDHDELLYNGSQHVISYDPQTGKELWRLAGSSREAIPTLVIGHGMIFSASGRNGPVLAIRPGGLGNITDSHLVWKTSRGGAHVPSPLYHNPFLYMVNDAGILTCLEAENGVIRWQKRLRGRFTVSPLKINDYLLFTNESGVTYILKAGDAFTQIAVNDLQEPILATPAVVDNQLFFRTNEHLICIRSEP